MDLESVGMLSATMMLLSIPVNLCVAFAYLDAVEGYLKYSTFIVIHKYRFSSGIFGGRQQRLFAAAVVILMPKVFERRYLVLAEDVQVIPKSLKLWIVLPALLTFVSIIVMIVSGVMLVYRS